ncbi:MULTISPECIES: spore coat U domain-containing protein [unclassified Brenneria]|uniref:Csu type fimbrial protein n=1 Tax=unclassified Brenneria TaxID=2634434 RepID=UPI0029C3AD46|nr:MULTISPECIES: spore coat U domain-containing protein [unclassified Brenneria]MDX5629272.1 spore coat U domain-containing protein [Brenneria sp. L3-3Z]MDX5696411.1 spore coat U domain-containing protein [Brenneria sp. L4-2C]MEE3662722.1 spore coat U domain-containing protein [Brenneria sp. g21c3]
MISQRLSLLPIVLFSLPAAAVTVSDTFTVSADIEKGCAFGRDVNASQPDMGAIDFGTLSAPAATVDVASTVGGGSIVVTCTPGIAVSIELDYGLHGGDGERRYVMNTTGSALLPYQLYRDAARTQVWGSDDLAMSISSFPATTQTYTVYARYFGASSLPPAGEYTDSITVSLSY